MDSKFGTEIVLVDDRFCIGPEDLTFIIGHL